MTDTHESDDRLPLSDDDLREMFLELAEPLPSEQVTDEDRATIARLTAEADRQARAKRSSEIDELHKMLGPTKDIR